MTQFNILKSFFEDFFKKSFMTRKNHSITEFFESVEITTVSKGVKNE